VTKVASQEGLANARDVLARRVLVIGIGGIILVSSVAISLARDADRAEMARLVFASILPLFGTWVGTVLAFYFARENLVAATESTERLLGLKPTTPVTAVMIPRAKIVSYDLQAAAPDSVPLADLYNTMVSSGYSRIPVLDRSGAVVYVVHKSTIDAFAAPIPQATPSTLTQTIHDLLLEPKWEKRITAVGIVGPNAVIADARRTMSSISNCQDVFVTSGGTRTGPVIGWLTNIDLAADV
jgi:CBS domain-containing protein